MDEGHVFSERLGDLFIGEFNFLEETRSDTNKGILGPFMEPINAGGVDKTREGTSSLTEGLTDGRETQAHVQVLANLVNEEVEQSVRSIFTALGLGLTANLTENTVKFILGEQVGNVTGRQDIIDEDEEMLLRDLSISQDEKGWCALDTRLGVSSLNISLQIVGIVVRRYNNSEHFLT